ncbi:NAD(P)/FAD-dependent oxidoreductase [Solirubrobacter sp. CPCC 204708]|uniref:NAD(P)/FAD-dependent oxidoreductase n=1 Tax=Solirubrobacter deserti TaxID=2282478 RepID=A0ABT4RES7_9ACTN|nr:NAD(P)/FAD-dependent oxidoreductase [Solirubrobacter deserti]MBE2318582.1 NAD(P)/FAD-dependent oxidoreductase [Solirubrobacter deserti]MDA0137040.1 NAD(P)/FAD-dependent oxidoreductase [Solirubrobacter deserti]
MTWDCIVVGGGAAGLSAALVLGRARRRTLIIDKGEPSNRFAHGIGGLLGQDGRAPQDFYADGRAELAKYPTVEYRRGEVTDGEPGFTLTLADGTSEATTSIILATGMDYVYPDVPGLQERWGRTAFHCPFCHGWEVRDRPLFVLDPSEHGPMRAQLLSAWSDDVTLLDAPPQELRDDEIVLADGTTRPCGGLLVGVQLAQRDGLAAKLGVTAQEPNPMFKDGLVIDERHATNVPGVFAAGDLTGKPPSVAAAVASGSMAAAMAVHALVLPH